MFSNTIPAKKMTDVLRAKASARSKPSKLSISARFLDRNLQDIGTEQVRQVMRAFLSVVTQAEKDQRER